MVPCQALLAPAGGPICLFGSLALVRLGLPPFVQEAANILTQRLLGMSCR